MRRVTTAVLVAVVILLAMAACGNGHIDSDCFGLCTCTHVPCPEARAEDAPDDAAAAAETTFELAPVDAGDGSASDGQSQ